MLMTKKFETLLKNLFRKVILLGIEVVWNASNIKKKSLQQSVDNSSKFFAIITALVSYS